MKQIITYILTVTFTYPAFSCLTYPLELKNIPDTDFGLAQLKFSKMSVQLANGETKFVAGVVSGKDLMYYSREKNIWCHATIPDDGPILENCQKRVPTEKNKFQDAILESNDSPQAIGYVLFNNETGTISIFSLPKIATVGETKVINTVNALGGIPDRDFNRPTLSIIDHSDDDELRLSAITFSSKNQKVLMTGNQPHFSKTFVADQASYRSIGGTTSLPNSPGDTDPNVQPLGCGAKVIAESGVKAQSLLEGNVSTAGAYYTGHGTH